MKKLKTKKRSFIFAILFLMMTTFLYSAELKVFVIDKELEFGLEGAKIIFDSKKLISAEANQEGKAVLQIPENVKAGKIQVTLPGYKTEEVEFKNLNDELIVQLSMTDAIEGEELVVNRSAPENAQEKSGVSTVMTKEEMHTVVSGGLTEDIMGAVSTLPGVSFSGDWSSEPSIRGGYPRELSCVLDGMYMIYPWHWGGNCTVFNPSMVETVKLSNGIFSAKYGRALSGLMEVTTIKPDFEKFHLNATVDTSTANLYMQIPFGKKVGGMLLGTKVTYLDPMFFLLSKMGLSEIDIFSRAPYIRDAYVKAQFNPIPELDIAINGLFGSDGLSFDMEEKKDDFTSRAKMDYDIFDVLAGINVKYLASDKIQLHALLSYNMMYEDLCLNTSEKGTLKYTDGFIAQYGDMLTDQEKLEKKYRLPELKAAMGEKITEHLFQGKLETDIELTDVNHLCVGVEEVYSRTDAKEHINQFTDVRIPGTENHVYKNFNADIDNKGNENLISSIFATWNYGNENSLLSSEIGVRSDFYSIWNTKEDFKLNLIPTICPRASVVVTPWRDINDDIEKISLSLGAGLFSSLPMDAMLVNKEFGFKDFETNPNRALFTVLGAEIKFADNWSLKTEAYYKYYLSRIYSYSVTDYVTGKSDVYAKDDGKSHIFGIDAMLQKKKGKIWDGYLSYSFLYAKYLNPAKVDGYKNKVTNDGAPLNEWYFPAFHRFHTANLVSNWHFGNGWTFTVKGTIATGTPKEEIGAISCYATRLDDGTVVQRYTRSSIYSSTLRTQISCPVDLRISYIWKSKNEKVKWETYFGVEDVFVNLYSPKGNKSFNQYSGEESSIESDVNFNIGLPLPSVGVKVQF